MITQELREAYHKALPLLTKLPGLTGVELGLRTEDEETAGGFVLRFRVSDKLSRDPELIRYARSQSIEVMPGEFKPAFNTLNTPVTDNVRTRRSTPIQPGISVGCFECGTLGMMARDMDTGSLGFITCYHVISGQYGSAVTQPGPGTDRGNFNTDVIGYLAKFLTYKAGFDAAFVRLNGVRTWSNKQFGNNVDLRRIANPVANELLTKSGRTTGITSGTVMGSGMYTIPYPFYGSQVIAGYSIAPPPAVKISDQGDSGAIWYGADGTAKGLHFATDKQSGHALACRLPNVFSLLRISPLT